MDMTKENVCAIISNSLKIEPGAIKQITELKNGMTNESFRFEYNGKKYIIRIPGKGTDKLINRKNEYHVYQLIRKYHICDEICYINPETGYKISLYLDGARACDPSNKNDVSICMDILRKFHELNLQVDHTFDIFEQIDFYETLWGTENSCFQDYAETKEHVFNLRDFIDQQPKQWGLAHIDAIPDNFLFVHAGNEENVKLLDWEYAGMQDQHVDLAMFAIYSFYDKKQLDDLIDIYFEGKCDKSIRLKIYAYVAICGLLWSNWCEYKRKLGIEFGEYALKQYQYARDFYQIFMNEYEMEM